MASVFKKNYFTALLTLISFLVAGNIKSQDILGSEFRYQCVGPSTYQITYYYYFNCNNTGIPATIDVDWTGLCGSGSVTLNQLSVIDVTTVCAAQQSSCNGGTGSYGVERVEYLGTVTIPSFCTDVTFSNDYSNRQAVSNNVGGAQMLYVENTVDNSLVTCNNSPQFLKQPVMYTLVNGPNSFSNEAADLDGDSLYYSIVPALTANSTSVVYNPGYTAANPFGLSIPYSINPNNGTITYTGTVPTGKTVLAIQVDEYRNGVKIGSVVRDWTMEHFTSSNANSPVITGFNGGSQFTDTICPFNTSNYCIPITISDADAGDNISWIILNDSASNFNFNFTGTNPVTVNVCWNSSKPMTPGTHYFSLEARDDACPLSLRSEQFYSVTIKPQGMSVDTYTQCDSLTWMDGNTYYASNNTAQFIISGGSANGCDSVITLDLTIDSTANSIDTYAQCDSLLWIDGNTYYSSNNTAQHIIPNGAASGCDSIVTLNLTIDTTVTSSDDRVECDSLLWIDGNTYYSSNNTAQHVIIGGAASGCDSVVTLNLTITPVNINVTASNDSLTATASLSSYQWLNCDSNFAIIPGAINQLFIVPADGNYAVEVTTGSCVDTSACINVTNVGIEEQYVSNYTIYPNPTNDIINIKVNYINGNTTYELTTIEGKQLMIGRIIDNTTKVNLSNYPKGIYLIKIHSEVNTSLYKIIKQ